MSEYTNRIQIHQIQRTISNFDAIIRSIDEKEIINADSLEHYERIKEVFALVKKVMSQNPNLIPPAPLNNLNAHLQGALNELVNFENTKNLGHLKNSNANLDNLLTALSQIDFHDTFSPENYTEALVSFRESAGNYTNKVSAHFSEIENTYNKLKQMFDDLKKVINIQQTRLDTAITTFQSQFTDTENKRNTIFNDNENKRNTILNDAENKRNETFNTSIDTYKSQFDTLNDKMNNDFKTALEIFNVESNKFIDNRNKETNELIARIKDKKEHAESLLNIIANVGMAGGYQNVANSAKKSRRMWQGITVFSLLGLITFAVSAYLGTFTSEEFNLGKFGARLFGAISFGILAAYSAREAQKSSNSEIKNRQIELELASIDLYLNKLPEDKQIEIKSDLAKKWFGNLPIPEHLEKETFNGNANELLKMVLNNLTKISK